MAKQIMVVDDDVGTLELLHIILKRGGFEVLKSQSAVEALDMLESSTPDLFVLDIMMPGMNGIELCEQIRAQSQTTQTPVIFLSSRGDIQNIEASRRVGADDFVHKPVLAYVLLASVRKLLNSNGAGKNPGSHV